MDWCSGVTCNGSVLLEDETFVFPSTNILRDVLNEKDEGNILNSEETLIVFI